VLFLHLKNDLEWSAIREIKRRLKVKTEGSFMTDNKINMAGLSSAKAQQLQEQYGKTN